MNMYNSFFHVEENISTMEDSLARMNKKLDQYMMDISHKLMEAITSLRGASLSDNVSIPNVKSVFYTPNGVSSYNKDETTATVSGSFVYGILKNEYTNNSANLSSSRVAAKNIEAVLTGKNSIINCIFKDEDSLFIPSNADTYLINTDKPFSISGYDPDDNGKKEIEVIVDREDYSYFNNIQIKTDTSYIYDVYHSEDKIRFTKMNELSILSNHLNVSFDKITSRYVKIVVRFSHPSKYTKDGYEYSINIERFYVSLRKYDSEVVFVPNEIDIKAMAEYFAIDTCDNYQNKNVSIRYSVSIDGGPYRNIKPVRKTNIGQVGLRSLLPINDYVDNKALKLDEKTAVVDPITQSRKYVYTQEMNNSFLETNKIRVFSKANPFRQNGSYYTSTGLTYKDKEIILPPGVHILLNGTIQEGRVTIFSGMNTIDFPSSGFTQLFNPTDVEIKSREEGKYTIVRNDNGQQLEIIDPHSSSNGFSIALNIFDYILGEELTYNEDYFIESKKDSSNIVTKDEHGYLLLLSRSRVHPINKVRLRVKMQSLDKYTQPRIGRIIFKVS